ncbi:6201_t:CDS:2, partial [Scutellospora calospora]
MNTKSFDTLAADEKFKILDQGTTDPFVTTPETIVQEPIHPTDILLGLFYQLDYNPFMDMMAKFGSEVLTLVHHRPFLGVVASPLPSSFDLLTPPLSTPSICIILTLKIFVEYYSLKDLIFYTYEMMLINLKHSNPNGKSFANYHSYVSQAIEPKQKKKIIKFSHNLEQHYTPIHYTIRPPPSFTRRMTSSSIKIYKDQGINNHGSWVVGTYQNDDVDEFAVPPVPPLVKSSPRCISYNNLYAEKVEDRTHPGLSYTKAWSIWG